MIGGEQRTIDLRVSRLAIDALFARDAAERKSRRPSRSATVLGLSETKIYVVLDEPAIEVKIYVRDLERALGERIVLGRAGIALEATSCTTIARLGDPIAVRVAGRDRRRDRWQGGPRARAADISRDAR